MSSNAKGDNSKVIFWVDCEMTGLENDDELIEIAVVPTDFELNFLDNENENHGVNFVIKPTENGFRLLKNNAFVSKMHKKSGLTAELENGEALKQVEEKVLKYMKKFEKNQMSALLGGNSVYVDRRFINKYMPKVASHLHYRLIDVSTIKELSKKWYPQIFENQPSKDEDHRAFGDIIESIEELKFYRENVFK